jgi:hypothetical protein
MSDERDGKPGPDPAPFELEGAGAAAGAGGGGGAGPVTACPDCGQNLEAGSTLCTACGFNLLTMAKVASGPTSTEAIDPQVAAKSRAQRVAERAERERVRAQERAEEERLAAAEAGRAISEPGGLGRGVLLVIGACLLGLGVGLGAYTMPETASVTHRLARGASIVLGCLLHIGTGLGALWMVAQLQGRAIGRIDLAVERLFVCVAACLCLFNVPIPVPYVGPVLRVGLGAVAYIACVFGLFGRDARRAGAIAAAHATLAALVYFQASLWAFAGEGYGP